VFNPRIYAFHFAGGGGAQRVGFAYRRTLRVRKLPDLREMSLGGTVRAGADIEVTVGGVSVRLLAVHLKARCAEQPLDTASRHCRKLKRQIPLLEAWIDRRGREKTPFLVVGDFNRRFVPADEVWRDLDDGEPPDADLTDLSGGRRPACWGGRYKRFIDFILAGRVSAAWAVPGSFREWTYEQSDAPFERQLSDHCPLSVSLRPR